MGKRDNYDPQGKGWFALPGRQKGDRTLSEQLIGLEPLLGRGPRTVLDLGCAEGLIGLQVAEGGMMHGIESVPTRCAAGRKLAGERPALFICDDLDRFAVAPPAGLLGAYDVVLVLSIAQKMRDPAAFLRAAAERCADTMAIRLPEPVICDKRSKSRPVDVAPLLAGEGFQLFSQTRCPRPRREWVGLFRRR